MFNFALKQLYSGVLFNVDDRVVVKQLEDYIFINILAISRLCILLSETKVGKFYKNLKNLHNLPQNLGVYIRHDNFNSHV